MRIGLVSPFSPDIDPRRAGAFLERLRELGYVEGQNVIIERRWAKGQIDRLPELMGEVVDRKVDVIVTSSTPAAIAAKKATSTIPIVDVVMGDPIVSGIVASLGRPGGNLTGLSLGYSESVTGKWLELMQEMVPGLSTVAVMADLNNSISLTQVKRLEGLAPIRHLKLRVIDVRGPEALDHAFEQAQRVAQAVLFIVDPNLILQQRRIVALATKYRLPDMHLHREFVEGGGLMAYAPNYVVMWRRAADYVDKILKGAKPSELPIEQPTKFDLIVNLKTAKALGLKVPEAVLIRADEVIQ
jgi:putative ABC transport system substrate-binding protein